jgi:hypothetical protein
MKILALMLATALVALTLVSCATTGSMSYDKPGFVTDVKDGRLWVFRAGSKELEAYKRGGEPAQMVTRIAAGPNGMTIRATDAKTIDDYLATR